MEKEVSGVVVKIIIPGTITIVTMPTDIYVTQVSAMGSNTKYM